VDHAWLWLFAAFRNDRIRLLCPLEHRLCNWRHAACAIALLCCVMSDSVFPEMCIQAALGTCRVHAVGALEWLFAAVLPEVPVQA
jgi:hypothetical protein